MAYKYSTQITENCAKVVGISLPISRKHGFAICKFIRGLALPKAKKFLEEVISLKRPVPFTKFTDGLGHKPGIAAGRYPVKASTYVLKLLKSVEANAQVKGLSTANLIIKHIVAQNAPGVMRSGRRQRDAKRTHIEIVVEEVKKKKEEKPAKKRKQEKKPEIPKQEAEKK